MSFDGLHSTFANCHVPTGQRQANVNVGGGNNGNSVSLLQEDTASYMPWKPTEKTEYNADNYTEGSFPSCKPLWSSKTFRENLQQYCQPETEIQRNHNFPPNYVSRVQGLSEVKDFDAFHQQMNGLAINHQQLFNLPNGERNSYNQIPPKLPPGLPVVKAGNTYRPQIQLSKYDSTSADKDRGNSQSVNSFPDLSDLIFIPQSKMNSPYINPYYEDNYIQSSAKSICNEQYVPEDIYYCVRNQQQLMSGEQDNYCRRDTHKQSFGTLHDDNIVEKWKIISPTLSSKSAPAMHTQKQLVGDFGMSQRERNGSVMKHTFICDGFQEEPLGGFQQPELLSASVNLPNQYQKKTMHRDNSNVSMNQYMKHQDLQGHMQNIIKPQKQKEKKTVHMPGHLEEGLFSRPLNLTHMKDEDKKQDLLHNSNFDLQGGEPSLTFNGENGLVNAGNTQQSMPLLYPDLRGQSSISSYSDFSFRYSLPYEQGVPHMDVRNRSASESAAFSAYTRVMSHRGERTNDCMTSPVNTSVVINRERSDAQLFVCLDECYEQWRCLEKERKRIEVIVAKTFVGKWTATETNNVPIKTPPNPTRIDHLIVKMMKEQTKVAVLLNKMECLCNIPLHINIRTAPNQHLQAICLIQGRRKDEIASVSKHQQLKAHIAEGREILLVIGLKQLAAATRKLLTALWCALQMTLPRIDRGRVDYVNEQATCREGCPFPCQGYSFKWVGKC